MEPATRENPTEIVRNMNEQRAPEQITPGVEAAKSAVGVCHRQIASCARGWSLCWEGLLECFPCCWKNTDGEFSWFGIEAKDYVFYDELYERVIGVIDFITDMIYFADVLHQKISNNSDSEKCMKAFLFICSFFGLWASFGVFNEVFILTQSEREIVVFRVRFKYLPAAEISYDLSFLRFLRSFFEDMPQVVLSLVIEHYRIQEGIIDHISYQGMVSIAFSILSMLWTNYKEAKNACEDVKNFWGLKYMAPFFSFTCIRLTYEKTAEPPDTEIAELPDTEIAELPDTEIAELPDTKIAEPIDAQVAEPPSVIQHILMFSFYFLYSSVYNLAPCIITACILYT